MQGAEAADLRLRGRQRGESLAPIRSPAARAARERGARPRRRHLPRPGGGGGYTLVGSPTITARMRIDGERPQVSARLWDVAPTASRRWSSTRTGRASGRQTSSSIRGLALRRGARAEARAARPRHPVHAGLERDFRSRPRPRPRATRTRAPRRPDQALRPPRESWTSRSRPASASACCERRRCASARPARAPTARCERVVLSSRAAGRRGGGRSRRGPASSLPGRRRRSSCGCPHACDARCGGRYAAGAPAGYPSRSAPPTERATASLRGCSSASSAEWA